ncbi:MAG: rRNA maturation RNase YbeY [Actinobacteria bacterium]|nr:rRNA maturation RNase YbeY [Actinomycetota bacterium]
MSRNVEVLDRAGAGISEDAVRGVVHKVMEVEQVDGTITVVFVDEAVMGELNERYRGIHGPTDVLSFPETGDATRWPTDELGEIVICPAVVQRYAIEDQTLPARQLAWTIIHGVLHLLGYDHETDRGEMRRREQALLTEIYRDPPVLMIDAGT